MTDTEEIDDIVKQLAEKDRQITAKVAEINGVERSDEEGWREAEEYADKLIADFEIDTSLAVADEPELEKLIEEHRHLSGQLLERKVKRA